MKLKTSRGKTFDVDFAAVSGATNRLHVRLGDERALARIARDFDELEKIQVDRGGDVIAYDGPFLLESIIRDQMSGRIMISMKPVT